MKTVVDHQRHTVSEEQVIYDHLLYWIDRDTPEQMIQRFRTLFLEGKPCSAPEVTRALNGVLSLPTAPDVFPHLLNRCCHILINRWQSRPQFQLSIPLLIELFESVPDTPLGRAHRYSTSATRLQSLVKNFRNTEQYAALRRLAQVLSQAVEPYAPSDAKPNPSHEPPPLGQLIQRYPYLYKHCLLTDNSTQEQKNTVQQVQFQAQQKLELDLSRYVTYQVRRSQLQKQMSPERVASIVKPMPNPTLLSDQNLNRAIQHYCGRAISGQSYRDVAQSFITLSRQSQSYSSFKDDLYQYIISGVDASYGQRQFNNRLHQQLKQTLSHSEAKAVNDFLVVRTCSQLLNFLVVDNAKCPQHFVFVDLITNLGPIKAMGLLLRIVLFCSKVRPYLERRCSILFSHYETSDQAAVRWLVYALETLNIALVTNFGNLDLSFVKK